VTPEICDIVRRHYLPDGDFDNPMASVLFADHKDLPPALVVTCEHDILRNEGVAVAASMRAAGVDVTHLHMDDMPHGYLLMTRLTKRSYETIDAMIREASKHFS
jgi:acetyl esterase